MENHLKKPLLLCLFSGAMGAFLFFLISDFTSRGLPAANRDEPIQAQRPPSIDSADPPQPADPTKVDAATALPYSEDESTNIRVYENVNRSVVNISTRSYTQNPFFMVAEPQEGSGSGSVVDKAGHILTNYHVIEGASFLSVTLFDGSRYNAEVVGADPENDSAIIKVTAPAEKLFPVKFGTSDGLKVGQKILAIGNPFGLERTLSVGIISALNRTLPGRVRGYVIKDVIQIDAALNSGNSGGPLLNSKGELIGMNTAIANPSRSGENTGVGFSIPVNTLKSLVPQLVRYGKVIRPDIGIVHTTQVRGGLRINIVSPNGPAAKAGLRGVRVVRRQARQGRFLLEYETPDYDFADTIVALDQDPVTSYSQLREAIEKKKPGDRVKLTVVREGRQQVIEVELEEQQ